MPMTKENATISSTIKQPEQAGRAMRSQPMQVVDRILERASRSIRLRGVGDRDIILPGEKQTD